MPGRLLAIAVLLLGACEAVPAPAMRVDRVQPLPQREGTSGVVEAPVDFTLSNPADRPVEVTGLRVTTETVATTDPPLPATIVPGDQLMVHVVVKLRGERATKRVWVTTDRGEVMLRVDVFSRGPGTR